MAKMNRVGVEMLKTLSRNGSNAVILCKCPICGQLFSMQRSHFYRGSNGCKCQLPISKRLYSIWINIKSRCYNPKSSSSQYYFHKGIKMCKEWKNRYKVFESWAISNGYKENLTIDRINNTLGYCPDNCRWVSYSVQNKNKSNNISLTINDITRNIKDWSIIIKVKYKTVMSYYYRHGKESTIQYINDKIKQLEND